MTKPAKIIPIKKCLLGVPGFGLITDGGAPEGRTTLLAGAAGSGKTASWPGNFRPGGRGFTMTRALW
ncbi:MAG: hypothetical protein IID52_01890 [Proteobacteria bacterium]|nr:hypothetical protein [Pseudomonadota bacterium]MCH8322703.1 hypothetical protein [Pseudomonadota bacterium]